MPKTTVRAHYEHLKRTDYESYKKFNSALAGEDLLRYFERSVVSKVSSVTLLTLPSWIRTCMIQYMGFTHEQFDSNTMPELPGLPKEAAVMA
ncbi:hypothetical protein [Fibrella aestuarina]|uniref:hypothetical protein n=1 Tax=Fibrella aestuarina TaxID=651143 RepID=UPI00059D2E30|nr:hypothetical protein [Fibrella aestuarina]